MTPEDFMAYFHRGKPSTNRKNARRLKMFCDWLKTTPQQLITEYEKATQNNKVKAWHREQQNRILGFYNAIIESGKSINYARNQSAGVLSFHRQNTQRIEDITREFAPQQMATGEFVFTQDILRKMFYLADTEGKALISLAVCYAQHSKDYSLEELRIKLSFKEEIEESNLFLAASLAYFFVVLFACLTEAVERYFGITLILTAIMIVWYFRDKRKEIRRKYEKQIELLSRNKDI